MTGNKKNYDLTNVSSLEVMTLDKYYHGYDKSLTAGEKFLQTASMLAEGEYLGFQISPEDKNGCVAIAFSSLDVSITQEDYAWIFHDCADATLVLSDAHDDMFSEKRKAYALFPRELGGKNDACSSDKRSVELAKEYFAQLLDMIRSSDAVIRIVAEPVCGNPTGRGRILFSLPHALSLRARTMLAMAFPGAEARELDELTQENDLLDGSFIKYGVAGLLNALLHMQKKNEEAERKNALSEDERFDAEPYDMREVKSYTPIETLDLSIRVYHCLKRAGIDTVEELRAKSDDELIRIRNLGRKCFGELKKKLAEEAKTEEFAEPNLPEGRSYMELLDELVGLDEVKAQVKRFASFAKMKQEMSDKEDVETPLVLNMEFVGNPGTAKTTVARIVSGILHETGLLPECELVEVGRADLVGKYTGHTADKVKEVFKRAKGNLLFIDEAYALVDSNDNSFGDEAISTIVQEMENNRDETVVIFAGYPDKMKELFSRNPGLRSRVPFTIRFQDYSAEEMAQIVEKEVRKRGFSVMPEVQSRVLDICALVAGNPDAGNGRFCRNLAESAVLSYADRIYGGDGAEESTFSLIGEDFSAPSTLYKVEKSRLIGFNA